MPRFKAAENRHLPCVLTNTEVEERSQELALAVQHEDQEIHKHEGWLEGMKQAKKVREAELARIHSKNVKLSQVVSSGLEEREVACEWLYHLSLGKAFVVRQDTDQLVETVVLRTEQLQELRQVRIGEEAPLEPSYAQLVAWGFGSLDSHGAFSAPAGLPEESPEEGPLPDLREQVFAALDEAWENQHDIHDGEAAAWAEKISEGEIEGLGLDGVSIEDLVPLIEEWRARPAEPFELVVGETHFPS